MGVYILTTKKGNSSLYTSMLEQMDHDNPEEKETLRAFGVSIWETLDENTGKLHHWVFPVHKYRNPSKGLIAAEDRLFEAAEEAGIFD